jgi:hypothetical protein
MAAFGARPSLLDASAKVASFREQQPLSQGSGPSVRAPLPSFPTRTRPPSPASRLDARAEARAQRDLALVHSRPGEGAEERVRRAAPRSVLTRAIDYEQEDFVMVTTGLTGARLTSSAAASRSTRNEAPGTTKPDRSDGAIDAVEARTAPLAVSAGAKIPH